MRGFFFWSIRMAKLSPVFNWAELINGIPATGAKVFTYVAGSSTKQNTYTDEGGLTANPNPIVLDARGEPPNDIWLTEGQSYKFVFTASTDTDPPTSPIRTIDDITGVNDTGVTTSQWVDSGVTPTYVNATSFTLPGDQTTEFQVNRRIKATVTAGTEYGYISASVFGALTTVTVVLDSGALDSGLSAVQLGLITPANTSFPILPDDAFKVSGSSDKTKLIALEVDGLTTGTTRTWTAQDKNITVAGLDDVAGGSNLGSKLQNIDAAVDSNALTITINPTTLDFRSTTLTDGTPNTVTLSSPVTVTFPNGATGGTINGQSARFAVLAINNAGTIEAAAVNLAGGNQLDETNLITTTTIGTGADSNNVIYSTTGRTNVAYRVVGFIDITEATAGVWATSPNLVQGYGGQALAALSSLGYGQTWQDFTGSRAQLTTYYNTTGKSIAVAITGISGGVTSGFAATVNGVVVFTNSTSDGTVGSTIGGMFLVPVGQSYSVQFFGGAASSWKELR
jgi:hypothetical protein